MDYQIGQIGRVVVARCLDGEDLYSQIESLAAREGIGCGAVVLIGGVRKARMAVGPKKPADPKEPGYVEFDDGREVAGVGTIFLDEGAPKLHLHASTGRGSEALVGCPRGGASVYCVVEAIIFEVTGVNAAKKIDPKSGLKLLTLSGAATRSTGH